MGKGLAVVTLAVLLSIASSSVALIAEVALIFDLVVPVVCRPVILNKMSAVPLKATLGRDIAHA